MSGYKALRDVSNHFENDLQTLSAELFTARIGDKFEEAVSKKMRDLALYSSKLKLLKAKTLSVTPDIAEIEKVNSISDYEQTACNKVLEQMLVKSSTQGNAVKKLLTTPCRNLDPELAERKEETIRLLLQFRDKETTLRHLQEVLDKKEAELAAARVQWDEVLGELKTVKGLNDSSVEGSSGGPLYSKLHLLSGKLELMRWALARLLLSRGQYDWLSDPRSLTSAFAHTRTHYSVQYFMEE